MTVAPGLDESLVQGVLGVGVCRVPLPCGLRLQKEQKVSDGPAVELRHRVFIYGTLKHGQPNHHLMNMHELGRCRLIGCARTDVSYPLIITTRWNLPFLLYAPGHGQVL